MGWKRVLVALGVAGAAFGIATAVQASIPDSSGIVHSCYNTSRAHGTPTGAMRAIDTDRIDGNCASWEGAVDLATPQYVQNVVTSTINQTSFVVTLVGASLTTGQWIASYSCPPGYVTTDPAVAGYADSIAANEAITVHTLFNQGAANTGTMNGLGELWFALASDQTVSIHATCVDGRVFGLPGPAAPIKQAEAHATISVKPA